MKSIRRPVYALAVFSLVVLTASCGDDGTTPAGGTGGGGTTPFNGTVRVVDNQFIPRDVTISAGDSVTWRFEGSNLHTVTEGANLGNPSPLFGSNLMSTGTFGFRFQTPGTFPYHCIPHFNLNMRGSVTVK